MAESEFAYGTVSKRGCGCPARQARVPYKVTPFDTYDKIVSKETSFNKGTVPEEKAKEYWLKALEEEDEEKLAIGGLEVAWELGWV